MQYKIRIDGKEWRDPARVVVQGDQRGGEVVHQPLAKAIVIERRVGRSRSASASDQTVFALFSGPRGQGEVQFVPVSITAVDPNSGDTIYDLSGTGAVHTWQLHTGADGVIERVVLRLVTGTYKDRTGKASGAFDVHAARRGSSR